MALIYLDENRIFSGIEELKAYDRKWNHEQANSSPLGYKTTLDILELVGPIWDAFDRIRFHRSCNCDLVEVDPKARKLLVGVPNHHYWMGFNSSIEAIQAGFETTLEAESKGIALDQSGEDFRKKIDELWEFVLEKWDS